MQLGAGDPKPKPKPGPRAARAGHGAPQPSLAELADELAEAKAREAERARLLTMARETGLRIREHLRVEDLVGEARVAIEENLDCDRAYLHLLSGDDLGPPIGHERDWLMRETFLDALGPGFIEMLRGMYHERASMVAADLSSAEAAFVPQQILTQLRAAGIVSLVLVPFGSGPDVLGLIVAVRLTSGRPFSPAEVAAMEWIAADLGRGLHHARLYEEENHLVEELRAVDRAKSDFLATVSHELRAPLTSIAGFLEIMRDGEAGPLTPAQEHILDTMGRNTERLRGLIENLLTLSSIESGAFRTVLRPVDLAGLIRAAATALAPQAAAKGLTMTARPLPRLMVDGDPGQLDRMLLNLLSNAVKFTPAGGRIEVAATAEGGMGVIEIADTGIGVPRSDHKDLFTRFFRASNAVDQAIPGTGLGLAIARAIVDNHGGDLRMRSGEGEGTTVSVRIPLLREAPEQPR